MSKKDFEILDGGTMRALFAHDAVENFLKKLEKKFPYKRDIAARTRSELPFGGAFGGVLKGATNGEGRKLTDEEVFAQNAYRVEEWKQEARRIAQFVVAISIFDPNVYAGYLGCFLFINFDIGLNFLLFVRQRFHRSSGAEKSLLQNALDRTFDNETEQLIPPGLDPVARISLIGESPPLDETMLYYEKIVSTDHRPASVREYPTVRNKYRKLLAKYGERLPG